jgi:hypothetical protein
MGSLFALEYMSMSIAELEYQIRDIINTPRKQHALLQNCAAWYMLCSCLDVIGDTEMCFDAFLSQQISDGHFGTKYLAVYGALQAIFVQQDAVANLAQALNVPYTSDPVLQEIRDIRNDSVGHPTKRGSGQGRSYNHISQFSLGLRGFDLMTTYADGSPYRFIPVDIPDFISKQRAVLTDLLLNIINVLRREEMEHRAKFTDKKFIDLFPPSLGYHFEKVFEGLHRPEYAEYARLNIEFVQRVLEEFTDELGRREIDGAYDGIKYTLELLEYPLQELRRYFQGTTETTLNAKSAYIFAYFARAQVQGLEEMAVELDEEYAKIEA